jgi:hypothetical protein
LESAPLGIIVHRLLKIIHLVVIEMAIWVYHFTALPYRNFCIGKLYSDRKQAVTTIEATAIL